MKKIILLPLVLLLAGCGKASRESVKENAFAMPVNERAEYLCGEVQSHLDRTARKYEQFLSGFSDGKYKGKTIWKSCLWTGDDQEGACIFSMEEEEPTHDWDDLLQSSSERHLSDEQRAINKSLLEGDGIERNTDITSDMEREFIAYRDEFLPERERFNISECQEKIRGMSDKEGYSYYSEKAEIGAQIPEDFISAAPRPYRGAEWDDCILTLTQLADGSVYRHCGGSWPPN